MRARPHAELERLYREEGPRLQRALLLFTGDVDVANDAVAEAFAQALRRGDELRSPLDWVWRVAYRVAAGELKGRRRTGGELPEGSQPPEADIVDLVRALRRLSPKQRGAVVLHHSAGYSAREVARIIDSTRAGRDGPPEPGPKAAPGDAGGKR